MESRLNAPPAEPGQVPLHGFRLLIELEPWLGTFWRNLADLFRKDPLPVRLASPPGEYWQDAQVHRPVAWMVMVQSYLGHLLALAAIYGGSLWWLNQPHVISEEPPKTTTILNYQLSKYLPEVRPKASQPEPALRARAQKADPEYSPQRIISVDAGHNSTRQTIIQPPPNLLSQDVRLPNLVASAPVPIAPPEVPHKALLELPASAPVVAPPPQATAERSAGRLLFPPAVQPEVIAPSGPVAANRPVPQIPAMSGPVVIPPAQDAAPHDSSRLQLEAQAPPQVAAPPAEVTSRSTLAQAVSAGQPQVVPPSQQAVQRNLAAMGLPGQAPAAVPTSQPAAAGTGPAQAREMGQLLALNARPEPPVGPVTVPEGNRKGEFAAGPEGHAGASAAPEIKEGNPSPAGHPAGAGGPAVYVDAPPVKVAGSAVVAAPRVGTPLTVADAMRSVTADVPAADTIDNRIFGGRKRYSMHLNMPNLTSSMASWTVRFAELNSDPATRGDLTAPEAIHKVDPAYPANLMNDRVEGVVVLHAIIRSDGSVGDVSVLEGFYEQLDENARVALEQWRFRPGTKNGVPVDVEAVVRVPFRASRGAY